MKNTAKHYLVIGLLSMLLLCTWALPYVAGRIQYANVNRTIDAFELTTDADINQALNAFGFDLDLYEEPTFKDYYVAGWNIKF